MGIYAREDAHRIMFREYCLKCRYQRIEKEGDICEECLSAQHRNERNKPLRYEEMRK